MHVLLAIALELPEDFFLKTHTYDVKSEDHLRYMKYSKFTPEENLKLGRQWVRGHTGEYSSYVAHPLVSEHCDVDLGSWTLLFRQPVAALQIQNHKTEEWKWVKPQDATLTVNACDALSLLTADYVKSTIHRCAHTRFLSLSSSLIVSSQRLFPTERPRTRRSFRIALLLPVSHI